jgi:hypothetical protein
VGEEMTLIFLLLIGLFIKHFIVDFPLQKPYHYLNKGTYLHAGGIEHAILHTLGTFIVLMVIFPWDIYSHIAAVILAIIDGLIHYHIDWVKTKLNTKFNLTPDNPQFWTLLGFDQLLHALTYILLIFMIVAV